MIVFETIKKVNGRTSEKALAETVDLAKVKARNWVRLDGEAEWSDESPGYDWGEEPKKLALENPPRDTEVVIKRRGVKTKDE